MAASMLELFRILSSFSPQRVDLQGAPWERYVDWAVSQGLAPLAAYNLEYRLGQCGAPQWARDRLLSVYQGSANDNVMKLVNLKRAVDDLEGRRIVLLGAASFAECLYPHVAFRPVIDVRLYVPSKDVEPLVHWLRRSEFVPEATPTAPSGERVLTDGRTMVFVHGSLTSDVGVDEAMLTRALPIRFFGPSMQRLSLEDALLVHVSLMARSGFEVPMLDFIDLREMVLGAPSMGGDYSHAPAADLVTQGAKTMGIERALWAALGIVASLFPETASAVEPLRPSLLFPTRELLQRLLVTPLSEVGRTHAFRGEEALRAFLTT
jgi:hypothetical protein